MSEGAARLRDAYVRFALEEITSTLRHDLRNRLASIRNARFYLRRKVEAGAPALWSQDARVPQMLALIESEVDAAESLVASDLAPRREPAADVGVAELLGELVGAVSTAPSVRVQISAPSSLACRVDPTELGIAIYCLLQNAVDAVGARSDGEVAITGLEEDGAVVIEVVDNGPGMDPERERRAWEPFFTTKLGRLGLGLNVVRRIARRLEASVELGAATDHGLCARLRLRRGPA